MNRFLLVFALVWIPAARPASGDPEEARKEVAEAEALLKSKDYAGAAAGFEKALAAEPDNLFALRGRAEALLGAGKKPEAVAALHEGVDLGERRPTLPASEVAPLTAMRNRLAELDPASAELEGLLRRHADALAGVAAKWMTKDSDAAEQTLVWALRMQPDHAVALERLSRLQRARAGKVVTLFNGRNFVDWTWANAENWRVKDGMIEGEVLQGAKVIRTVKRFDGDQEVGVEARLARPSPDIPYEYGVIAAYEGDGANLFFGVASKTLKVRHLVSNDPNVLPRDLMTQPLEELDPPLKPEEWHAFALHLDGQTVRVVLDGKVIASVPRPPERRGGYVGLFTQGGVVQYRQVEIKMK